MRRVNRFLRRQRLFEDDIAAASVVSQPIIDAHRVDCTVCTLMPHAYRVDVNNVITSLCIPLFTSGGTQALHVCRIDNRCNCPAGCLE
jgi:hypothetical protein